MANQKRIHKTVQARHPGREQRRTSGRGGTNSASSYGSLGLNKGTADGIRRPPFFLTILRDQLPQHIGKNTAVLVVIDLYGGVDSKDDKHLFGLAIGSMNDQLCILLGCYAL